MRAAANDYRFDRRCHRALVLALMLFHVAALAGAGGGPSPPTFTKAFMPDTIGPGSVSMLTFTIDNSVNPGDPVGTLAFDDEFPFGMDLAAPAFVSNSCAGTVTLDEGDADPAFDVRLVDGMVGAGASCEIVVNVIGTTDCGGMVAPPGAGRGAIGCANTSGDLTSDAGNSGPASASLFVDTGLPGFSKSFSPSTVALGGRSTLTLTIDNSANLSAVIELDFTDTLPGGMVIAAPALASTTCGTATIPPTLTAIPGTDTIVLDANGTAGFPAIAVGATCAVDVDVVGGAVGLLGNVSDNLLASFVEAGKAAAVLEVTGVVDLLELSKEFIDDPVAPGGMVTLEFTVTNKSRTDSATGITFIDDLEAALSGLVPTLPPTPDPPCGVGSALILAPPPPPLRTVFPDVLTLTGGTLPAESSCTFSVELSVPGTAAPGTYPNTTSAVSGTVGGSPETGNTASDLLFVVAFPVLTKEFTDDPVAAGDSVTLEFTISNPGSAAMTGITFGDELTDNSGGLGGGLGNGFLPFPVSVTIPPGEPCGTGSSLALVSFGTDRQGLELTGGSLAATGMAGDSCTFSVSVDIPVGFAGGTYLNTTEEISATVAMATVVGPQASDSIVVASAPTLTKEFTDDPVLPAGGTVTLEFNLSYDVEEGTPDATAIAFTDDLTALSPVVPGLVATSVDTNTCAGSTVDIVTDPTMIAFSGGTLAFGQSCTVILTLTVPAASPAGSHTNTTSEVTATVGGVATSNLAAEDDLEVTPLAFTKEFLGNPVIPGDTTTLRFTIENLSTVATDDASGIIFTDSLTAALSGLAATGPPSVNTCGGTLSGTTLLTYSGGSLTEASTCTIEVEVLVPAMAADGDYLNITSSLTATIDGSGVTIDPATDVLTVDSELLEIIKEFTDDPVQPGGPVTLEFTLTNLSATETVTDIAFTDNLGDAGGTLLGLEATSPALLNDCGGMATLPATTFGYAGGTLLPGASCTIRLSLDVPAGPLPGSVFPNTTSDVAGKVGTLDVFGSAASDDLDVQLLTLSKSFDGPTTATGSAVLSFTLTNLDSAGAVTDLAFSDDLDAVVSGLEAVLPPTPDPPCGAGSVLAGTGFLTLSGGSLAAAGSAGDSCTFEVTVTVPGAAPDGSFLNTTSDLFVFGVPVADPATAFLDIEPPPAFSKEFAPDAIDVDDVSTLTFTIDNTASALDATALDFTDTFPVPVVIATPAGASTDCTGGVLTATAGAGVISYTGGSVAAGASCTVVVDVTADTAGVYDNTSGDLTSSSGNSGPASDTLTVVEADLELVKRDVFDPVMTGRYQIYQVTVTNLGPDTAEAVVLDDVLPVGTTLVVAEPVALCSEAGGIVTCALGDLPDGDSVTVTIMVYVELTAPMLVDNMATVSSDTVDPDPTNNDVMESTEVILHTGLAALDDVDASGFPEVAVPLEGSIDVLVKDADTLLPLHLTEVFPDGWTLAGFRKKPGVSGGLDGVAVMAVETATGAAEVRVVAGLDGASISTAVVPTPHLPVTMTVIPDDGTGRQLVVVATVRTDGRRGKVFSFDCSDGSLVSEFPLHPGAWPIGLAGVASFAGGDSLAELGVLWINTANGGKRIQVKQLDGTSTGTQNIPIQIMPLALEGVPDCCGGASDEVSALGWDRLADRLRLRTVEASGGLVQDGTFGNRGQAIALRRVPNFGGSSADELVTLFRNPALRAAVRGRDAMTGANLLVKGYGPVAGSVPLGLGVSPSVYDTVADEVSVYWLDPATGDLFVTVRDAGSGSIVANVPIP